MSIIGFKRVIKLNSSGRKYVFFFNYRRTWWWNIVHYNYFHKVLFREFYHKKPKLKNRNYYLYKKLDDIITLRNVKWLRILIFKLEK